MKLRSRPTLRALDGFEHTGVACETQEIQSGVFSEFLSAGFVLKNFFPNSSSLLAGHFELLRKSFRPHTQLLSLQPITLFSVLHRTLNVLHDIDLSYGCRHPIEARILPLDPMPRQRPRRVILVDDEESIRLTLAEILRERALDVIVAGSVDEAVHKIRAGAFDVVLSNLNIRRAGDGFEVIREARQRNPRVVAILLTGYPGVESAIQGIRQQIDDYFVKPCDVDLLVKRINEILDAKR